MFAGNPARRSTGELNLVSSGGDEDAVAVAAYRPRPLPRRPGSPAWPPSASGCCGPTRGQPGLAAVALEAAPGRVTPSPRPPSISSRRAPSWLDPAGASEAELEEATLTKPYNQRQAWLANAHVALDRAVLEA